MISLRPRGADRARQPVAPVGRAGAPDRPGAPGRPGALRAVRAGAAVAGLAAIAAYLAIAVSRLGYPFALERIESNSLVEVHRILAGRALYAPPTVSYVPDGYPPLYFAVSAALAGPTGLSYLPLRLVSLVSSLACFAVAARLVQRETASACAGLAAAGMFAATYFATGAWFDQGRVDSLFLALSVAAIYAARWMRGARGSFVTGLLLAAAFATKQTALVEGAAVLAALALSPGRRRFAAGAALTYAAVLAVSTLALGLSSHGWYLYYVFAVLGEHAVSVAVVGHIWTAYLLPALGLAVCAAVLGARRAPLVLVAGCAALAVEGIAALADQGGTINDLLPVYLAVAVAAGLALDDRPGGWAARLAGRLTGGAGRAGRWLAVASAALVIAQCAVLISGFSPGQAIPGSADRAAGARLTAGLRAVGGRIAVLPDPGLDLIAGLPPVAQQGAANDVLSASDRAAIASYAASAARAVATRRYRAILTIGAAPPPGFPPALMPYYRRCPQALPASSARALSRSAAGAGVPPVFVWLAAGRGACAPVLRALAGPAPPARQL